MISHDWTVLKAEAEILVERLRVGAATDEEFARIAERAQELQRLGWEARELLVRTEGRRMN